jgi:hypothetical protein
MGANYGKGRVNKKSKAAAGGDSPVDFEPNLN